MFSRITLPTSPGFVLHELSALSLYFLILRVYAQIRQRSISVLAKELLRTVNSEMNFFFPQGCAHAYQNEFVRGNANTGVVYPRT